MSHRHQLLRRKMKHASLEQVVDAIEDQVDNVRASVDRQHLATAGDEIGMCEDLLAILRAHLELAPPRTIRLLEMALKKSGERSG